MENFNRTSNIYNIVPQRIISTENSDGILIKNTNFQTLRSNKRFFFSKNTNFQKKSGLTNCGGNVSGSILRFFECVEDEQQSKLLRVVLFAPKMTENKTFSSFFSLLFVNFRWMRLEKCGRIVGFIMKIRVFLF
jgi:hypothetical protein